MFKRINSANFEIESIRSCLWDFFDALILVTRDITATADNNINVAYTNCALFSTCHAESNEFFKQSNFLKF